MYLMSAPATNACSPAPVSTTTRADASSRSSQQPVAQLGQRRQVERVQRVRPVDGDDRDRRLERDPDRHYDGDLRAQEVDDRAGRRARA